MKQTNDRALLKLLHAPTGEYTQWIISENSTPAVHYINERVTELQKKQQAYFETHGIDPSKPGWTDSLDDEQVEKITSMSSQINRLKMDALCSILEPKEEIPEEYANKREYLEQCISDYSVIPAIMDFFSEYSASSTGSHKPSRPPILIETESGQPWNSGSMKDSPTGTSSSA